MSLRKSPLRTPALLAANRANSLKSTGPRTLRGKARVSLNALKHGCHTRRLPEKLVQAGCFQEEALFRQIHLTTVLAFLAAAPFEQQMAVALATKSGACAASPGKQSRNVPSIQSTSCSGRHGQGLWCGTTGAGWGWSSGCSTGVSLRPGP